MSQWNFGSGTLQPLLLSFRNKFGAEFNKMLNGLMPEYGKNLFAVRCMTKGRVRKDCEDFVKFKQSRSGKLDPKFKVEVDNLFESPAMTQIQTDTFVMLLTRVISDVQRLFPNKKSTAAQLGWAIDVDQWKRKIQRDDFIEEQADLLLLSHFRSWVANTQSGLFQADTFQRRIKIAFGLGRLHGSTQ